MCVCTKLNGGVVADGESSLGDRLVLQKQIQTKMF